MFILIGEAEIDYSWNAGEFGLVFGRTNKRRLEVVFGRINKIRLWFGKPI